MSLLFAVLFSLSASAHHFTNTTTGVVAEHFPSAKVLGNKSIRAYVTLQTPLIQGERLVARWTPPTVSGPCKVYEYTVAAGPTTDYVTRQRWNSAALSMFCPGVWTCEIIVRKAGQPDRKLHELTLLARRR